MLDDWVSFIETCAENEENEVLRLTVSQVLASGNVTFILAEPFHAFGKLLLFVVVSKKILLDDVWAEAKDVYTDLNENLL